MNCKIHPVLYKWYLILHEELGASIVHRRQRRSQTCIEIIFYNDFLPEVSGRVNTLAEAEKCGYWVMCRPQTKPGRTTYKDHRVFQLFLTPVHPKKWRRHMPIYLPDFVRSTTVAKAVATG